MALSRAQMMAPDGRCKAFSAEANGFVRSDGCGIVVLKRFEDAQRDGDRMTCRDSRYGYEPGRPQQRDHGSQWAFAGRRNPRRPRGCWPFR